MSLPQTSVSAPLLPGARCAVHPERSAVGVCHRCGNYACTDCVYVAPNDPHRYCRSCLTYLQPPLADRGTRLVAVLVDHAVVLGPVLVSGILSAVLKFAQWGLGARVTFGLGVLGMLGSVAWQFYLLVTVGQSVGKRLMGIKVVRTDGSPVKLARLLLLRNLVPWILNLPLIGGLFSLVDALAIFTRSRRCVHDDLADTQVIIVPRPESGS